MVRRWVVHTHKSIALHLLCRRTTWNRHARSAPSVCGGVGAAPGTRAGGRVCTAARRSMLHALRRGVREAVVRASEPRDGRRGREEDAEGWTSREGAMGAETRVSGSTRQRLPRASISRSSSQVFGSRGVGYTRVRTTLCETVEKLVSGGQQAPRCRTTAEEKTVCRPTHGCVRVVPAAHLGPPHALRRPSCTVRRTLSRSCTRFRRMRPAPRK